MKNKYDVIKEAYEKLLDKLTELDDGDDIYDLVIEYRSLEGELIRISWLERNLLLEDEEERKEGRLLC